ncbi:MAG: hypothetical protein U9N57_12015 [Pseudomonadota bacterium]|nr:hypothetical protein [Pseudomonadota bacterium]
MTEPTEELVKVIQKIQDDKNYTSKDLKQLEQTLKSGADANNKAVLQFMHSYPSRVSPEVVCLLVQHGFNVNHIYKKDSNETAFFWWMEQLLNGRGRSPAWWDYRLRDEPVILNSVKCLLCEQTDWNIIWKDGFFQNYSIFDVLKRAYASRFIVKKTNHQIDALLDHIMAIDSVLVNLKTKIKMSLLSILIERKHPKTANVINVLRKTEIRQYRKRLFKIFLKSNLLWLIGNSETQALLKTLLSYYGSIDKIDRVLKEDHRLSDEERWKFVLNLQVIGLSKDELDMHINQEMKRTPAAFQVLMNKLDADKDYKQTWQNHFNEKYRIDITQQKDSDGLTQAEKVQADSYVKTQNYWDFIPVLEKTYAQKFDSIRNVSELYDLVNLLSDQISDYDRYIIRGFYHRRGTSTSSIMSNAWGSTRLSTTYSSAALEEFNRYDPRYIHRGLDIDGYEYHSMYGEHWYEEYSFKRDLLPLLTKEVIQKLRELGHEDI